MICHCDYCHYTFNADVISRSKYHIPTRCPDCGKKVIHTLSGSYPAVRAATEKEVADYYRIQREILDELAEEAVSTISTPSYHHTVHTNRADHTGHINHAGDEPRER